VEYSDLALTIIISLADYSLTCYDGYRLLTTGNAAMAGTCTACLPGTSSMGGLSCNPCTVGFYANLSASKQCNQCPKGTISITSPAYGGAYGGGGGGATPTYGGLSSTVNGNNYIYGVSGGTMCNNCPAGYYQPVPGGQVCIPCAPGSLSSSPGSVSCTLCAKGTASSATALSTATCATCPPNTYTLNNGSTVCS
jgi:hypothetical protein